MVELMNSMYVNMISTNHVPSVQVGDLVLLHGCCNGEGDLHS